jgi:cell wall assembly regulator SMI1
MRTALIHSGDSVTQQDISEFEKSFEVRLPKDYKDFLLETNGGRPEKSFFPFEDDGFGIGWFYNLKNGKYTLEFTLELLWIAEQTIPRNLIPIARGHGADFYCICLDTANYGQIYVWHGNMDVEPFKVANSFSELIEGLTDDPE